MSHAAHSAHSVHGIESPKHRRNMEAILSGVVSLLHEAGKLVLIEGVETEHEAQLALASGADFVQGFFFGRPNPGLADGAQAHDVDERTDGAFPAADGGEGAARGGAAAAVRAVRSSARPSGLRRGSRWKRCAGIFSRSITPHGVFYSMPTAGRRGAMWCFARIGRRTRRGCCRLIDAQGANWLRRPYFRAALGDPDRVHVTKPYLSINEALPCVTLSVETRIGGQRCVLCGDIDWMAEEEE